MLNLRIMGFAKGMAERKRDPQGPRRFHLFRMFPNQADYDRCDTGSLERTR